jgi:hypothetical protein
MHLAIGRVQSQCLEKIALGVIQLPERCIQVRSACRGPDKLRFMEQRELVSVD